MRPITCLVAIAAFTLMLSAAPVPAQSSAPPPPKDPPERSASPLSAVPPPVALKDRSITDLLSSANTGSGLKFEALVRAAPNASKELLEKGKGFFDGKGNLITAADIGIAAAQGNYADVKRKSAAAVIDKCVDAAITALCTAATTPVGAPGCVLAVQAVRFCGETYFNQSVGGMVVEQAEQRSSLVRDLIADKTQEQASMSSAQQAQFNSARTQNEDYAAAAAAQPPPYLAPEPYDDGSSQLLGALMSGIAAGAAPGPNPPLLPASAPAPAAPEGCHAGHNESAHPGGCHDAPLGQSQ